MAPAAACRRAAARRSPAAGPVRAVGHTQKLALPPRAPHADPRYTHLTARPFADEKMNTVGPTPFPSLYLRYTHVAAPAAAGADYPGTLCSNSFAGSGVRRFLRNVFTAQTTKPGAEASKSAAIPNEAASMTAFSRMNRA